jgi:hypothetical protein
VDALQIYLIVPGYLGERLDVEVHKARLATKSRDDTVRSSALRNRSVA